MAAFSGDTAYALSIVHLNEILHLTYVHFATFMPSMHFQEVRIKENIDANMQEILNIFIYTNLILEYQCWDETTSVNIPTFTPKPKHMFTLYVYISSFSSFKCCCFLLKGD